MNTTSFTSRNKLNIERLNNERLHEEQKFIMSDKIKDNETWNTCYGCNKSWRDDIPIPGLIHRTVLCKSCLYKSRNREES